MRLRRALASIRSRASIRNRAAALPRGVTVVSRVFSPESAAAAFRLRAVVGALARQGERVTVLTSTVPRGRAAADPEDHKVRVRRWPVLRDADGYVRGYLPYLSFDLPLTLRLAFSGRPDAILVEPPPTTGAVVRAVTGCRSLVRRLPYVYYAADVWSDASAATGAPAWVVHTLRRLESFALRGAAAVIAVSDGVADRVRELGAESVEVIGNGIDTTVFGPDGDTPREAPTSPFVLYAGTASEWQGAEIFAEAMDSVARRVPGASLVYLGQGSSWPRIAALAAQLPAGTIRQLPLVPPEAAAAWHRVATVAAVSVRPGLGYDFAYPTKVLAALACGTPVVYAGPGPAVVDLRDSELGTAVPYDVGAVADALVAALTAPADPARARHRAGWVGAHRSLARTGERAAAVVTRVAQPRRPGGAEPVTRVGPIQ